MYLQLHVQWSKNLIDSAYKFVIAIIQSKLFLVTEKQLGEYGVTAAIEGSQAMHCIHSAIYYAFAEYINWSLFVAWSGTIHTSFAVRGSEIFYPILLLSHSYWTEISWFRMINAVMVAAQYQQSYSWERYSIVYQEEIWEAWGSQSYLSSQSLL